MGGEEASWDVQKHNFRAVGRIRLWKKRKKVVHQSTSILIQLLISSRFSRQHFFCLFPFPLFLQQELTPQAPFLSQQYEKHLVPRNSTHPPPLSKPASHPPSYQYPRGLTAWISCEQACWWVPLGLKQNPYLKSAWTHVQEASQTSSRSCCWVPESVHSQAGWGDLI